ncbi:hypothetical protein GQ44DRAFT_709709 [Phaeosphaeriaceae sp. PMI808]|nr:hypothetical protein GQ44DRAFT_709709 [Phaeosphaeriaceae sp. PMI808]
MAGNSFEIVVLSSSPPAAELCSPSSPLDGSPRSSPRRVAMRASPLLPPSPHVSTHRKTPGASLLGTRMAPLPPDAIRGFATVGSLVQVDEGLDEAQPARSRARLPKDSEDVTAVKKPRKPRKPPTAAASVDANAKPEPKLRVRKSTTKKADKALPAQDPELRLPAPKLSPYFANEGSEAATESPIELPDTASKPGKLVKPRKPRAKKVKVIDGDADAPVPKKAKAKKSKGTVTTIGKPQREDACVESAHFRNDTDKGNDLTTDEAATSQLANDQSANNEDTLPGEELPNLRAKKKRTSKQYTSIQIPLTDSVGKENKQVENDIENGKFTHMVSNFAYAQPSAQLTATTAATTIGPTKRRRVELIDVASHQTVSRNSSPEKGKAPKKKARTITDIATKQYQIHNVNTGPTDGISDFFEPQAVVTKVPLNDVTVSDSDIIPRKPARKRSKSKPGTENAKPGARTKKASSKSSAKPKPVADKLLDPESALLRLNQQDMLFGTSSQLALEESPTMVRQLQFALKESEEESNNLLNQLLAPPPPWPRLEKSIGKRSLWNASSRDGEGGLLEQQQATYVIDFDRTQDFPLLMDGTNDKPATASSSFLDIDDINVCQAVKSSDQLAPSHSIHETSQMISVAQQTATKIASNDAVFEDIDDFNSQPPPSNQNAESKYTFTDIAEVLGPQVHSTASPAPKKRPPASVLGSVNSQPKKSRGRPPKSQSTTSSTNTIPAFSTTRGASENKATAPPTTPSKGSGRFIDIDEILDSEDEIMAALSPTPPRVRKGQNSEPLTLYVEPSCKITMPKSVPETSSLIRIHRIPTTHLMWDSIKPHIFPLITSHIRSLQQTTDPKKPSWHEKILMYEPIVLEDFTVYLNTVTNIRTFKRATKIQIKAWNKNMKVTGGEELIVLECEDIVLAVEKELEAWQVQAWCESMSVCCIWGEGKGRGVVRKSLY